MLRARPANDAEYWVVVDMATGRLMAQGSQAMCEHVVAVRGRRQGDLFDE